jgi:hypothetical protein
MSLDRIEDGERFRSSNCAYLATQSNVGLEIMTVAPKAKHVAVAEALIVGAAELRQLEVGGVRRQSFAVAVGAVVNEQYGRTVPRHALESLHTATVSFDLGAVHANRRQRRGGCCRG